LEVAISSLGLSQKWDLDDERLFGIKKKIYENGKEERYHIILLVN
jgi:hypothetical protein